MTRPTPLSQIDFSEIQEYLDRLEASNDQVERERYKEIVCSLVDHLGGGREVQMFVLECGRYAAWGESFADVRAAFASLAAWHAGHNAAALLRTEQRSVSAEHGKKGGRPSRPKESDMEMLAEYERRLKRNPSLSVQRIAEQISESLRGTDQERAARTIEDAIRRAQKVRGKPPF